jgi:murein L,D-transpeptidase YafK
LGGDIFIHGSCVTIGCIPIEDENIKELYLLAIEAKSSGQASIPVHIFPCKMNKFAYSSLKEKYSTDTKKLLFWENLLEGFNYFEKDKKLPKTSVDKNGKYQHYQRHEVQPWNHSLTKGSSS